MIIGKEFVFDAAHKLKPEMGKCGKLHGHTYKLQVRLKGPINDQGIIIDLKDVKSVVKKRIVNILDHQYLNDVITGPYGENNTSIESICVWIWNELKSELPLYEITLWETQTTFAIYNGPQE